MRFRTARITVLFLGIILTGCVTLKDPETSLEYTADVVGSLSADQTIGQTLVSRRPRLNSIQLWLRQISPPSTPGEVITFELFYSPQDTIPLITVPISYRRVTRSFPLTITFPPRNDPAGQTYYVLLRTASGSVQVFGRLEDAYPKGELMIDGVTQQADAAFRTSYDYDLDALLQDINLSLPKIWLLLPLLMILWLPGRLLVYLLEKSPVSSKVSLDWGQRTALSVGLSLAVTPVIMLWTSTLNIHWNRPVVLITAFLLAGIYAWKSIRKLKQDGLQIPKIDRTGLLLLAIISISLGVRLVMVRDLAAPAWVDSVHHATIVRVILEKGGFPDNYEPYVATTSADYHPGFHSIVASFEWLSGTDTASAMLLIGQVLNALSVLAVYLFTMIFTKDRTSGLVASLVTGFFSPMPAYYASWGRYTQLTGLLILPVGFAVIVWLLEDRWGNMPGRKYLTKDDLPFILLGSIACGGLAITHYRVILFLGFLLVTYLFSQTLRSLDKQPLWRTLPSTILAIGIVIIGAVVLTSTWWPNLIINSIQPRLDIVRPAPQPLKIDWGYLTPVFGKQIMILAGLGLIWSILRARWFGLTLALWIGLLFISANQGVIRVPAAGFINKTSVEIMLFMPISLLTGYLVGCLIQAGRKILPLRFHLPYHLFLVCTAVVLAAFGALRMLPLLNPVTFLFREADKPALEWVQEHLPANETILINPFHWNVQLYAGQDGGYWITPMAGRKTYPPPVLYDLGDSEKKERINQTCRAIIDRGKNPADLYELMQSENIRYVYLGVRGGVLSPLALKTSPQFRLLYNQEGVWIFEIQ